MRSREPPDSSHQGHEGWETVRWVAVESAVCAFADSRIGQDFRLSPGAIVQDELGVQDGTRVGIPLVGCNTREDSLLPVEILKDRTGRVVASRMCFTDDVDDLAGTWLEAGRLEITADRAVAVDPYCSGPAYRVDFELASGSYVAQVFKYTYPEGGWDVLALRICQRAISSPGSDRVD